MAFSDVSSEEIQPLTEVEKKYIKIVTEMNSIQFLIENLCDDLSKIISDLMNIGVRLDVLNNEIVG